MNSDSTFKCLCGKKGHIVATLCNECVSKLSEPPPISEENDYAVTLRVLDEYARSIDHAHLRKVESFTNWIQKHTGGTHDL